MGGESAVIETYPYQVSLQLYDEHYCGGAIISEYWIITAGHCIEPDTEKGQVRAGATFHDKDGSLHNIVKVILHDNYELRDDDVPLYDIALIEVKEPFMFDDTRRPIELFKVGMMNFLNFLMGCRRKICCNCEKLVLVRLVLSWFRFWFL